MKYSLVFFETASEFAKRENADAPAYWSAWGAYIDLLAESGVMVPGAGAGLQPPSTATTVRMEQGKRVVQDGPVPDTKEQLAGFVLIDVESLDHAINWAAKAPCASDGGVEVRPVLPSPEG